MVNASSEYVFAVMREGTFTVQLTFMKSCTFRGGLSYCSWNKLTVMGFEEMYITGTM